jgi:hypothetical protein
MTVKIVEGDQPDRDIAIRAPRQRRGTCTDQQQQCQRCPSC